MMNNFLILVMNKQMRVSDEAPPYSPIVMDDSGDENLGVDIFSYDK